MINLKKKFRISPKRRLKRSLRKKPRISPNKKLMISLKKKLMTK